MNRSQFVSAAINTPLVVSEADAHELLKRLGSNDASVRKSVYDQIGSRYTLLDHALEGRDMPAKVETYFREKSASTAVNPNAVMVNGIVNDFDRLRLDTQYMDLYQFVPATNKTEVHIEDFEGMIRHAEIPMGKSPEATTFGQVTKERFGMKQWGGKSFALNVLLNGQARYNVNGIVRGHQLAELRLRSNEAYSQLANVTANGTTAFATSIVNTINQAYITLIQDMATAGHQMSDTEPAYVVFHGSHRAAVSAALRTIMGENGSNILLEFPVQPIFTWNANFPSTFAATPAGMLVFPGRKNVYANFQNARLESEMQMDVDGMMWYYRYYFNSQIDGSQVQIVNIA